MASPQKMSDKLQFVAGSRMRPIAEARDKLKFVGHRAPRFHRFRASAPLK